MFAKHPKSSICWDTGMSRFAASQWLLITRLRNRPLSIEPVNNDQRRQAWCQRVASFSALTCNIVTWILLHQVMYILSWRRAVMLLVVFTLGVSRDIFPLRAFFWFLPKQALKTWRRVPQTFFFHWMSKKRHEKANERWKFHGALGTGIQPRSNLFAGESLHWQVMQVRKQNWDWETKNCQSVRWLLHVCIPVQFYPEAMAMSTVYENNQYIGVQFSAFSPDGWDPSVFLFSQICYAPFLLCSSN